MCAALRERGYRAAIAGDAPAPDCLGPAAALFLAVAEPAETLDPNGEVVRSLVDAGAPRVVRVSTEQRLGHVLDRLARGLGEVVGEMVGELSVLLSKRVSGDGEHGPRIAELVPRIASLVPTASAGQTYAGATLVRRIGNGLLGSVWEATETGGARVAVKVFRPALLDDSRALLTRFHRGIVAHRRVSDGPTVVTLRRPDPTRLAYSMDLLEGGNLRDRLRGKATRPLGWDLHRKLDEFGRLLDAVLAAERAGVRLCDIKPTNLLLDADDHLYLEDFSHAGIDWKLACSNLDVFGERTGAFVAPELQAGCKATARSVVYSLGRLLRYILADGDLSERSGVPSKLRGVIDRAESRDPLARHATVAGLRTAIEERRAALRPAVESAVAPPALSATVAPELVMTPPALPAAQIPVVEPTIYEPRRRWRWLLAALTFAVVALLVLDPFGGQPVAHTSATVTIDPAPAIQAPLQPTRAVAAHRPNETELASSPHAAEHAGAQDRVEMTFGLARPEATGHRAERRAPAQGPASGGGAPSADGLVDKHVSVLLAGLQAWLDKHARAARQSRALRKIVDTVQPLERALNRQRASLASLRAQMGRAESGCPNLERTRREVGALFGVTVGAASAAETGQLAEPYRTRVRRCGDLLRLRSQESRLKQASREAEHQRDAELGEHASLRAVRLQRARAEARRAQAARKIGLYRDSIRARTARERVAFYAARYAEAVSSYATVAAKDCAAELPDCDPLESTAYAEHATALAVAEEQARELFGERHSGVIAARVQAAKARLDAGRATDRDLATAASPLATCGPTANAAVAAIDRYLALPRNARWTGPFPELQARAVVGWGRCTRALDQRSAVNDRAR